MIFVTVGTQLPFDRLIRTMDRWASAQPYADAFAQIGPAEYRPTNIPWAEFLDAGECRRKTEQADVVVAHAGMGSILTALELGRPVLVMPRLSALGEHRNDHQLDTAKKLMTQGRIFVAFDENELLEKLEYINKLRPAERIPVHASSALISTLRKFVGGLEFETTPQVDPAEMLVSAGTELPAELQVIRSSLTDVHGSIPKHAESGAANGSTSRTHSGVNGIALEAPRAEASGTPSRFEHEDFAPRQTTPANVIKARLAAVILLAGRLQATDLGKRIGRSRLDLPIDQARSILSYWRDEASHLAQSWDIKHIAMRVLLDQASQTPTLPSAVAGLTLSVERDQSEYRGTGGVLRDICDGYDDDEWVLVANAAQLIFQPLSVVADRLAEAGGEINVVNDYDGIPNGLILLRCGVLRKVSDVGFHDMKEQVVPALARRRSVKVISGKGLASRPIHSLADYTEALRRFHGGDHDGATETAIAFGEKWQHRFAIREQGSVVAASALIHDAVILEGAAIEKGAVVVRSVVGRGARVGPGQVVIDQVVN